MKAWMDEHPGANWFNYRKLSPENQHSIFFNRTGPPVLNSYNQNCSGLYYKVLRHIQMEMLSDQAVLTSILAKVHTLLDAVAEEVGSLPIVVHAPPHTQTHAQTLSEFEPG
jgi:hypothetical protein